MLFIWALDYCLIGGHNMGLRYIINLYKLGNVCVVGLKGRGKDMLQGNVIVRRKIPYISNVDYGGLWIPLNLKDLDCGNNKYRDFINGTVKYYKFPYPDNTDVYISDVGIYFPAQYCNELNRDYPYLATYAALSRQVADGSLHVNCQNLNRIYDKLREQSDFYIMAMGCKVIFGIVFQRVRVYEKYESCVNRMLPFRVSAPLLSSPQTRAMIKLQKQQYECTHGMIKSLFLVYRNKSTYNTRIFKEILENGIKG